jgi:hypothetical protein
MAHFFGSVIGRAGKATRLGTINSGLDVTAASWQGAISVRLYARCDIDMALVYFRRWHGAGSETVIYDGPVSGYPAAVSTEYREAAE